MKPEPEQIPGIGKNMARHLINAGYPTIESLLTTFIFCSAFLAGCATITKGGYQEIKINSNVNGAIIEIDGVEMGYTPYIGRVKRGKEGHVRVIKPGYLPGVIQMEKKRETAASVKKNATLGLIASAPFYFILAPLENTRYKNEKADYERRKENGMLEPSEFEPSNNVPSTIVMGAVYSSEVFIFGLSTDGLTSAAWEYSPSQYYVQLKEENSSEQSNLDFVNELAIRYFATMNHSQIAIDASESDGRSGEYANALADFMETKTDGDIARRSINEALEKSKGDQILFGDELVRLFQSGFN